MPYTALRIAERFTFDAESEVEHDTYRLTEEEYVFDTMSELVEALKRDAVSFAATGSDWAADPDGSQIIDYVTGTRESVTWHFDQVSERLLQRVVIPAVG